MVLCFQHAWTSQPPTFAVPASTDVAVAPAAAAVAVAVAADSSQLVELYRQHIEASIAAHEAAGNSGSNGSSGSSGSSGRRLGALLIEPVLQGAGGMLLPDPLYQAELVKVGGGLGGGRDISWGGGGWSRCVGIYFVCVGGRRRSPTEVFTGCWRLLGVPTAGHILRDAPGPVIFNHDSTAFPLASAPSSNSHTKTLFHYLSHFKPSSLTLTHPLTPPPHTPSHTSHFLPPPPPLTPTGRQETQHTRHL